VSGRGMPSLDAGRRRRFGVYSTPPELVGYMVRSAHALSCWPTSPRTVFRP
jgi:hypothetical protein